MNSSMDSGEVSLDGLEQQEAQQRMLAWLQATGCGREQVNYKLRDWLFARQRYWGEPFPIIFPEDSQVCHLIPSSLHSPLCHTLPAHTSSYSSPHTLHLHTHFHMPFLRVTSSHSPFNTHLFTLTSSSSPPHTHPTTLSTHLWQLLSLHLHTLHTTSCAQHMVCLLDGSQLKS